MANFGFAHLSVVAPYEAHWREAKSAVGAPEILQNAQTAESLAGAVADCTLVLGTATVAHRQPEQPVVSLPDLFSLVREELARGGRVALVFGPEKRGLTRGDLSYCHLLTEIPTHPRQPSMNLGQAVAVCLYELASRIGKARGPEADRVARGEAKKQSVRGVRLDRDDSMAPACAGDLELLAGVVEETMLAANYSPAAMRKANRHDVHLLLRRLALTKRDARRILGLFRRILWRLKR